MTECDFCGCTDFSACPGGCSWILPGVCSRCERIIGKVCSDCGNLIASTCSVERCSSCGETTLVDYERPSQVLEILENLGEVDEAIV